MLLSIVLLNYKKKDLTIACLHSLWEQYAKEFRDNTIEAIIIDNDSQDDSVAAIGEEIKKYNWHNMQVIANSSNAGFGAGCNLGARSAKGKYLLFLNNDTVVEDAGLLKMARYCEDHPEVSLLGGQLSNPDGSSQSSSGNFYTFWNALLLLLGGQRFGVVDGSPKKIQKVDWIKGGLFMIRKDVFERLHGFDEKIFMYTEDMELCYRANLAGKGVYFYPDVKVVHKEHGSASRSFAIVHIYKGLLYFYKKHRSPFEYGLLKVVMQGKAIVAIVLGKALGKKSLVDTYQQALAEI
jgi:GT2 family glycosyltransferase